MKKNHFAALLVTSFNADAQGLSKMHNSCKMQPQKAAQRSVVYSATTARCLHCACQQ